MKKGYCKRGLDRGRDERSCGGGGGDGDDVGVLGGDDSDILLSCILIPSAKY